MARSSGAPHTEVSAAPRSAALVSNTAIVLVWRSIIVIAAVAGILMNNGLPAFIFFTLQSNAFLAVVFGYDVVAMLWKKPPLPLQVKGAATLFILITGLVYNLILAPTYHPAVHAVIVPLIGGTPSNDLLHRLVPLMAILDWLLFDAHVALRWRTALFWLSYPIAYFVFVLVRGVLINAGLVGSNGTRYPYGFVNVDHLGYGGVALNALIYGFAFWLLGCVLIAINHGLARRRARSAAISREA